MVIPRPKRCRATPSTTLKLRDRKSTRLNSSHVKISYAVFCLIARPPSSSLFPYTTLFRSLGSGPVGGGFQDGDTGRQENAALRIAEMAVRVLGAVGQAEEIDGYSEAEALSRHAFHHAEAA